MNQTGTESSTTKYKTLFISDLHLGAASSRPDDLLEFLNNNPADQYYFVGDILDLRLLGRGFHWNHDSKNLIRWILKRSNQVLVTFIPGNHDEDFREIVGVPFGKIIIKHDDVYVAADGKRYYVTHGDEVGNRLVVPRRYGPFVPILRTVLTSLNFWINTIRSMFGRKPWNLINFLKRGVKDVENYVTGFENFLVDMARFRNCYGVITGHIHVPACKMVRGVLYLNCGDWLGNRTAIAEHFDGTMELVSYQD
jgi:UDP-2,3-diacylglucosamine pyrophosphatase LpxH